MNFIEMLLFSLISLAVAFLVAQVSNVLSIPKKRRYHDRHMLTREQKRMISHAKKMMARGEVLQAGLFLERSNLKRQAISLLEHNGEVKEAAKILLRMELPNRAGAVLARNGFWREASECYELAGLYEESARCAQESREYSRAAELFYNSKNYSFAANCYMKTRNLVKAAESYQLAGAKKQARECFVEIAKKVKEGENIDLDLTDSQRQYIEKLIKEDIQNSILIELIRGTTSVMNLIYGFLESAKIDKAAALFLRTERVVTEALMDVCLAKKDLISPVIAMFESLEKNYLIAQLYERLERFSEAAVFYEKSGHYVDATRCFEKNNEMLNSAS